MLKSFAIKVILKLQKNKTYRYLARLILHNLMSFRMGTNKDLEAIFRFYSHNKTYEDREERMTQFVRQHDESNENLRYFLVTLGKRIIGVASFIKFSGEYAKLYPDWWVFSLLVRLECRGTGVGEKVVRNILDRAAEIGSKRVSLLVAKNNIPAVKLYSKLGFKKVSMPVLEKKLGEKNQKLIVMSIDLT